MVDYRLCGIGAQSLVGVVAGRFAYGAPTIEIDAQLPIAGKTLWVAAGLS